MEESIERESNLLLTFFLADCPALVSSHGDTVPKSDESADGLNKVK